MKEKQLVIGLDYGTDSVRSVVVDAASGEQIGGAVHNYSRWADGKYCSPSENRFRQHPLDYVEGLETSVKKALKSAGGKNVGKLVKGISVDTTGSTPVAVDKNGTPLSMLKGFEHNPDAMFILWKDHTGLKEASEVNRLAHSGKYEDYTKFCGGIYSSEWFWAKVLKTLRKDREVAATAFSWVEHCDWIPALLTGETNPLKIKRSRCAAGHKAMWHESFGGLPSEKFLQALDPKLKGIRQRLYSETVTADLPAGRMSSNWTNRLGLANDVVVGCGAFDAHMGAVGAQIEPYVLCKVVGTSTCDMLIAPTSKYGKKLVRGICGQVDGSIIPGMLGLEAGQSAFGDLYAWFRNLLMWPVSNLVSSKDIGKASADKLIDSIYHKILPELSIAAAAINPMDSGILALDWINGRRTPDANQALKCAITGLSMGSDAPGIFRALVESTAFGARKITERFRSEGIDIKGVIASGGIPKKGTLVMQILADVVDTRIRVVMSEQACALGAAMFAATACGIYRKVEDAQKAMGQGFESEYRPIPRNVKIYDKIYAEYVKLGAFMEKETSE